MRKEIGTSLVVIIFCGVLVQQTMALPKARFEPLGPAFFPLLVLGAIIGLSLLHIALVLWKGFGKRAGETLTTVEKWRPSYANLLPWLSVLAFIIYILLISYTDIPYLLLTFGFVSLMAWVMASFRKSAILISLGLATGLVVLIQGVFVTALNIMLP